MHHPGLKACPGGQCPNKPKPQRGGGDLGAAQAGSTVQGVINEGNRGKETERLTVRTEEVGEGVVM